MLSVHVVCHMCSASKDRNRQMRLEEEFEADRVRKERQSEKEIRRQRKDYDDALRAVRILEADVRKERVERADRLRAAMEKRQRLLQEVRRLPVHRRIGSCFTICVLLETVAGL
jgi:hypothetical protein